MINFLLRFILALLILLFPTYSQALNDESLKQTEVHELQKIRLQLHWKHQFEFAGYYAAIEKGFYAAKGLEVELLEYDNDVDVIGEVISERTDYATYNIRVIYKRLQGAPVTLLGNYFKRYPLVILSQEGITTLEDLKGKRLMIDTQDLHSPLIRHVFKSTGLIPEKNIIIVPQTFTVEPFINNEIDAMTAYLSDEPFRLDEQGKSYHVLDFFSLFPSIGEDFLFTNEHKAQTNPQQARDFLEATNEGWQYALNHQDEIVDLILKKYSAKKSRAALQFEALHVNALMMPKAFPIGSMPLDRLQSIANMLVEMGEVENLERLEGFLLTSPSKISFTKAEQQWIKQHPDFIVGTFQLVPYIFQDQKTGTGYFVDILQAISQQAGLKAKFHFHSLESAILGMKQGSIDVLMGLIHSPSRESFLTFSKASFPISLAIFARNERTDIFDLDSLKGQKIASYEGYSLNSFFKKFLPDTELILAQNIEGMLRLVATGEADVAVQEIHSGEYVLQKHLLGNVSSKGTISFSDQKTTEAHYFGVRKELTLLKSILDKSWRALPPAEKQRIWNHWFANKTTGEKRIELTPEEQAWVSEHPVIRVPVFNYPPYNFWQNEAKGISIEMLDLATRKVGVQVEYQRGISWSEALTNIRQQKDIDVLANAKHTLDREGYLNFSQDYIKLPWVIFTREDEQPVLSLENLFGKTIAIEKDYALQKLLAKKYPQIKQLTVVDTVEALTALSTNQADAYIGNMAVAQYYITHLGFSNIKVSAPADLNLGYQTQAFAVRKDWTLLTKILDKGLAAITPEERSAIYRKYYTVKIEETLNYIHLWKLLLIIALIIFFILLWNALLRKRVAQKTSELQRHKENLETLVTKRTYELRKNEEMFRAIFENAPILINSFDKNGRCTLWNRECEKLFGYTLEEVNSVPEPISLFYPDPEIRAQVLDTLTTKANTQFKEFQPLTKLGHQVSTCWANFIVPSAGVINIGYNVTEQKKNELQLIEARRASESANRAKSEFLANMSHEIRTPMNAIINLVKLSLEEQDAKKQRYYLTQVTDSSELLLNIINDILDFSKIEAGKLTIDKAPFNLIQLLDTLHNIFSLKANEKGIALKFIQDKNLPEQLIGDALRLKQILINLIGNAIKFTEKGSITVKIELMMRSSSDYVLLKFSIADTGIGITQEKLPELFKAFTQAENSTTRQFGGSGLGLTISKSLTELLGGKLDATSELGQGSCFYFQLPFKINTATSFIPETLTTEKTIALSGKHLLVAEDNKTNRLVIKVILEQENITFDMAENGQQVLEYLKNNRYDAMLMDVQMPIMNGIEATKKIRQSNESYKDIKIIAMTAYALEGDKENCLEVGMNAYISKPIDRAIFLNTLKKQLCFDSKG